MLLLYKLCRELSEMKKITVLVENQYHVLEAWYPYLRLRESGFKTVFVGTGKDEYKSKEGYPVKADLNINKIAPEDFDGVIVPGGWAPDYLRRNKNVLDFVGTMYSGGKLVASICHAGWVLVSAGILTGKKVTCFSAIKDDIINAGAEYIDKEVVVDNNLITSRNPDDLPVFCAEIVKFLQK